MKRRTLLQALPAAAFLPPSLLAASRDSDNPDQGSTKVYELRVYQAAPGKLAELLARFREHTTKLFDKHGMKNVAYWTAIDEPKKSNTLIYVLEHPSRKEAEKNWAAFQADPEWQKVKAESEANGPLVDHIDRYFMDPTTYSALK